HTSRANREGKGITVVELWTTLLNNGALFSLGARLRRLRIGVIDLVTKGPTRALYARVMNPNLASIMPQAVAVWCEAEGHDVTLVCYTGFDHIRAELPDP